MSGTPPDTAQEVGATGAHSPRFLPEAQRFSVLKLGGRMR